MKEFTYDSEVDKTPQEYFNEFVEDGMFVESAMRARGVDDLVIGAWKAGPDGGSTRMLRYSLSLGPHMLASSVLGDRPRVQEVQRSTFAVDGALAWSTRILFEKASHHADLSGHMEFVVRPLTARRSTVTVHAYCEYRGSLYKDELEGFLLDLCRSAAVQWSDSVAAAVAASSMMSFGFSAETPVPVRTSTSRLADEFFEPSDRLDDLSTLAGADQDASVRTLDSELHQLRQTLLSTQARLVAVEAQLQEEGEAASPHTSVASSSRAAALAEKLESLQRRQADNQEWVRAAEETWLRRLQTLERRLTALQHSRVALPNFRWYTAAALCLFVLLWPSLSGPCFQTASSLWSVGVQKLLALRASFPWLIARAHR